MSNTLYPINYDETGFFSSNNNIIDTFPFDLSDVVGWAKTAAPYKKLTNEDASSVSDIFHPKLSAVIINPNNADSFVNVFLPGNIYLNDNFSGISVSRSINGPDTANTPGSVTIDGQPFNGFSITGSNGSTSYLLGTHGSQRVIYQPVCTQNHLHFPNGCSVQEIITSPPSATNKTSYFKCVCTGTPTFNSNPHSHCSSFTNNEPNANKALKRAGFNQGGRSTGSTTTTWGNSAGGTSDNSPYDVSYANADNLNQTDILIRRAIYDYYCAVNKNMIYKDTLKTNKAKSLTANQSLTDSTAKYKSQYLNAFNLLSGILIAGGYIFTMNKKPV